MSSTSVPVASLRSSYLTLLIFILVLIFLLIATVALINMCPACRVESPQISQANFPAPRNHIQIFHISPAVLTQNDKKGVIGRFGRVKARKMSTPTYLPGSLNRDGNPIPIDDKRRLSVGMVPIADLPIDTTSAGLQKVYCTVPLFYKWYFCKKNLIETPKQTTFSRFII